MQATGRLGIFAFIVKLFTVTTVAVMAVASADRTKRSTQLGHPCIDSRNCSTAFSECKHGKCECVEGTKQAENKCEITKRNCPYGKPLMQNDNKSTVSCRPLNVEQIPDAWPKTTTVEPGFRDVNGTCPADHFCLGEQEETYNGKVLGFCCPKPKLCPVGMALKNATCNSEEATDELPYCPWETHSCIKAAEDVNVCCPMPCRAAEYVKDGQCYPYLELGAACGAGDICSRYGDAVCLNGKCQCAEGWIEYENTCTNLNCPSSAKPDAPLLFHLNNSAGKPIRCNETVSCPANAYCTDENFCCPIPDPYCPQTNGVPAQIVRCDTFGNDTQCGAGKTCNFWHENAVKHNTADDTYEYHGTGLCCATSCSAA